MVRTKRGIGDDKLISVGTINELERSRLYLRVNRMQVPVPADRPRGPVIRHTAAKGTLLLNYVLSPLLGRSVLPGHTGFWVNL